MTEVEFPDTEFLPATMAWFDLETTGLEAAHDAPLELGIILTDKYGDEIDAIKWLVYEPASEYYTEAIRRGHANEFVEPMHTASKLWDDLNSHETNKASRAIAETEAIEWLKYHEIEPRTLPMCGNSIGSLDRPFALTHFPRLNEFLSYRNIDMSSFKEICKLRNPGLYKNLEPIIGTKADATHRVLDDCRASIREYQAYAREFLMVDDQ